MLPTYYCCHHHHHLNPKFSAAGEKKRASIAGHEYLLKGKHLSRDTSSDRHQRCLMLFGVRPFPASDEMKLMEDYTFLILFVYTVDVYPALS